ncbi:MAG: hypothetical protein KC421_10910, partial [Anaerolineales bacterium]|nr:hypothetical protein [Anaerolineales bacterium]
EYDAGLDVQWIDITDIDFAGDMANAELSFLANLDQFLCEGTLQLDAEGNQLYEPSGFRTDTGLPVSRPQCDFISDWEINNRGTQTIPLPAVGSFVTEPCDDTHPGPLRNCGFVAQDELFSCAAGEGVEITAVIASAAPPQILRICEVSSQLGTGVACTYEDAIANAVLTAPASQLNFSCPLIRDAETITGGYAVYTAPAFTNDAYQAMTIEQN